MNPPAAHPPAPSASVPNDRQRASPLRGWLQRLVHVVAVSCGWVLFVWGWHEVLGRPWDMRPLWWLILGSLVLLPLLTGAWILHNVGIHRRKGPRTGVRRVDERYRADWNGREVHADWAELAHARLVVIEVEGERKRYRNAGSPRPASAPMPAASPAARPRIRQDDAPPTEILPEGSTV